MKKAILLIVKLNMAALLLIGCGRSSDPYAPVKKLFKPSSDTDVTSSPRYNFPSFAGTVWKTKVKTAIAETERYTGALETKLLAPEHFDSTHPRYYPPKNMKLIAVLPVGTRLRIERLMEDQGAWGGVQVTAKLEDGTNAHTTVYLDDRLLANNIHLHFGPTKSTNWGINPEMLETGDR